jgi:tryptophan synthase alpha chain
MNRIHECLAGLAARKEKALALFLTAGFPRADSMVGAVPELHRAGADIIELGMPFSDPLADGPTIQFSSSVALKNGVTLSTILTQVKEIRRASSVPIVLMGYLNPVCRYGVERFFHDAGEAGVDGLIFPELPLEESGRFKEVMKASRLAQILLVAPTSSPSRIQAIDAASDGFVYGVSTTGVTGTVSGTREEYFLNIRRYVTRNPLLVGFGISTPDDARRLARDADGVIVGSGLIKRLQTDSPEEISRWVRSLKNAIAY